MPPSAALLQLSPADRRTVEGWLAEFDRTWDDKRLPARVRQLPPAGSPLRLPALAELVKLDLRRRWQAGQRVKLEGYLKAYPELGTPDTAAADLVLAEYEERRRAGAPDAWDKIAPRFPRQAEELRRAEATRAPAAEPAAAPDPAEDMRATRSLRGSTNTGARPIGAPELPEQFGRYRILKRLGQGGMGAVYLAHDGQLDRRVALKVPHFSAADGPDVLERFTREARAAATIDHPNVCPVYDVGTVNGISYVTMAYVEGKPLSELIREGKPLPQRPAAAVVRKLALALQEAHQHGVIHRDLKPSNVMVNKRNEPVVMDFGLARRVGAEDARLTKSGAILGTPAYMSPEQVTGDGSAVGPASDIYSLGVILYELVTGRLPFQGPTAAVLGQIMTQEPPRPSQLRPDLEPALEAVCLKAMAKRAADRYPSMADLAAALTRYLKGDPTQTAPARAVPPDPTPTAGGGPAGGEGLATQLLARLADRLEATPAPRGPAEKSHGPRWLLAVAAAGVVLLLLAGIGYLVTHPPRPEVHVDTTVVVQLAGLAKLDDPAVVVFLVDGKPYTREQISQPISLGVGDHELVMKRTDGTVVETRKFSVGRDDDHKTVALPPPKEEPSAAPSDAGPREEAPAKEPPPKPAPPPPPAPVAFVPLFNGKDLTGWTVNEGADIRHWGVDDGVLVTDGQMGGGWLLTEKEYADCEVRLEYRLSQAGNTGLALRAPLQGNPSYTGMEIQLLDNAWYSNEKNYKGLRPSELTGAIWDVVAPSKDATGPAGQWNQLHVTAKGRRVTVEVNGTRVLDANLDDYKGQADKHPGLLRARGRLGFQSYTDRVEFRKIEVKDLGTAGVGFVPPFNGGGPAG